MVVHDFARMAFGVVATVSFLFIWTARTAVAQAPAYAPAPGPGSGYTENYYNAESDVMALRTIIDEWKTINPNFNSLLPGWSTENIDPCVGSAWLGVFCYADYSGPSNFSSNHSILYVPVLVGGMTISNTDLAGELHPAFGNLTGLTFLYITGNPRLVGPIPTELGQLTNLEALDLHGNSLNGSIPYELGGLGNISELDLSDNQLTGNIPSNLGNATNLFTLNLSKNKLNGSIPGATGIDGPGLNQLKYLISLQLMENSLTGPLPDLRNLSTLTSVNVSCNQMSGVVVLDAIFNATNNMTSLDLSSNNFSGALPDFSKLSNSAVHLAFSDNSFDPSTIPSWLINFKQLRILKMANNSLFGPVPAFLVNTLQLQQLEYLNLERNRLDGSLDLQGVPLSATDPMPVLKSVNLTANNITDVLYNSDMLLSTSGVATVYYMLEGNPFCTEVERKNDTAAKNYFCRNTTTPLAVIYLDDRYRKVVMTSSVTLSTACLIIAVIAVLFCWKNRRDKKRLRTQIQKEFAKSDVQPTLYSYSELRAATRDFNQEMKVGEGAFGVVYKGVQPDGSELAVKHLLGRSQQGIDEFLNEVVLITGVRHRNLVKLKGCCLRDDKRLLVYEFVENHNLAEVLFEGKGEHDLNWGVRYNICLGVAQGLHYLDENAQPRIIHRDIKPPNILLDKNLSAKIADFGVARLFPDEESHISTLHIAGTTGYMAPEYASRGQLTEKADVFSYGVVVLEIVSGRKNIEPKLPVEDVYLIEHAWRCHEEGRLLDIVDNTLNIQGYEAEVERVINIALLCLQGTGQKRPSMARVVSLLKGEVEMEVVIREFNSSRPPLHASDLKTAQPGPDVTINIKQDSNLKGFEDEALVEAEPSSRASFPSSHMNSTYVEITTLMPR